MQSASPDLSPAIVARAYSRWAGIYDFMCGPLFRPAHLAAAEAANHIGGHILEVGVGTGLILPLYRRDAHVTGIDLSEDMLAKARERCRSTSLRQVRRLERMDVHKLSFPSESFDAVVMPFVLTLVASPETALDQAFRVLRPGGEVIVVSHFQSETAWISRLERQVAPWVAGLGLRPDFPVDRLRMYAMVNSDVARLSVSSIQPFGFFKLIRLTKA